MGNLTTLKLPIGSAQNRFQLTQEQVETLIKVYYDDAIVEKDVSGFVSKAVMTGREKYLLEQLGLDVLAGEVTIDEWSLSSSEPKLYNEESATLSLTGDVTMNDVMLTVADCDVTYGDVEDADAAACVAIGGSTVTFNKGDISSEFIAQVTIRATTLWNAQDYKEVTLNVVSTPNIRTVYINPANLSAQLESEGSLAMVEDYIQACKCYVFNAAGTKKAEIKSATFDGNYSGMSSGTVTFADGTTKNVSELNTAGCNFMVLRPQMHIWCGLDQDSREILQNTGLYNIRNGKAFQKKYIGMFKAFVQSNVLKSQPGRIPTGNQTIATFQQQAKAGGTDYGLWNYSDWCKENALHLAYFANTNYEVNVGEGRINNYDKVRNIVTGFPLPLAGQMQCGVRATVDSQGSYVQCLNFFGIEGMGEQIWEFVIGFRHNGSGTAYIWDDNVWGESYPADRTITLPVTSANQSYIKTVIAGQHFDMLPRATGGSSVTGMCDGHWISANGRLLAVGADAYVGSICGLSASYAFNAFSYSNASFGARLAFYGEPEEVRGSELVASL